uniref:Uncharacterized protein n=1 Tax=Glossina palpalis gambiensis TaxID=67801 RepID=A0A1B0BTY5_9MUSC
MPPRGSGVGTRHNLNGWPAARLGPFAAAMIASCRENPGRACPGLGDGCSVGCVRLSPLSDSFLVLSISSDNESSSKKIWSHDNNTFSITDLLTLYLRAICEVMEDCTKGEVESNASVVNVNGLSNSVYWEIGSD